MISAGYMAKRVAQKDEWLKSDEVIDIYSVSNCISTNFTDYVKYWKHNGYWLFDSPELIMKIVNDKSIDMDGVKLFYYEIYELEYDEIDNQWLDYDAGLIAPDVVVPVNKTLEGFDVVTFFSGSRPECSPLSCNHLAEKIKTNQHCLLHSFDEVKQCLESGLFNDCEPGPFRIFAVYSLA